jgi:hypothetical protein
MSKLASTSRSGAPEAHNQRKRTVCTIITRYPLGFRFDVFCLVGFLSASVLRHASRIRISQGHYCIASSIVIGTGYTVMMSLIPET